MTKDFGQAARTNVHQWVDPRRSRCGDRREPETGRCAKGGGGEGRRGFSAAAGAKRKKEALWAHVSDTWKMIGRKLRNSMTTISNCWSRIEVFMTVPRDRAGSSSALLHWGERGRNGGTLWELRTTHFGLIGLADLQLEETRQQVHRGRCSGRCFTFQLPRLCGRMRWTSSPASHPPTTQRPQKLASPRHPAENVKFDCGERCETAAKKARDERDASTPLPRN